jgi:3'-5' exoribonuclease
MSDDHVFLKDLQAGDEVSCVYFCKNAKIRAAKNGQKFVQTEVQDKTGLLQGFFWNAPEKLLRLFEADGYRQLLARVEKFQGHVQLNIKEAIDYPASKLDLSLYVPTAPVDLEDYKKRLLAFGDRIKNTGWKQLFEAFFRDEAFLQRYVRAPAARELHHPYFGGLLYHSVTVAEMAEKVAAIHPRLDPDLLILGALLHDIGKIEEIDLTKHIHQRGSAPLLGHIALGAIWLEERAAKAPALTEDQRRMLQHILLSHHGEEQYGSPVRPFFPEAIVIHFLDNLDARLIAAFETLNQTAAGDWSVFSRIHGAYLYKRPEENGKA